MDKPFVVNVAAAAAYRHPAAGWSIPFEEVEQPFAQLGINVRVLLPGQANGRYHHESVQEDFLVLGGRCTLIIDGEERALDPWDFVHCPPGTDHIFVGAGDGPCWILMAGARCDDAEVEYVVDPVAARYGASVREPTGDPRVAYADREGEWEPGRPPWPPR